ncbi:DUF1178 family protein [Rhodobaculum claviforme]|uniref:DUF1178 family protein n=1 Tax=Rhodobaculum claviforme TaxID=1549854 RepID=A0A934TI07_9RHOB|nr:DUF1178 family protein [Rhodobaculum claviforme]MBK5926242.1 hypothetical protein [Rhodobaculum claviforme]
MIRYALRCAGGHEFESWFRSARDYDTLHAAGHVRCPDCGAADVDKALMAPRVATRPSAAPAPAPAPVPTASPDRAAAIAELRRKVEAESDYVGLRFATEARRMHAGETPERAIYGEARVDEARALIDDGVPVLPLPFVPTRKAN